MIILYICIAIIVLALPFILAYFVYREAFYSPNKVQNDIYYIPDGEQYQIHKKSMTESITRLAALPCEQVYITSHDGLKLSARFYSTKEDAPLAICFHGYRGTAIRDFCKGAFYCMELGMNVLLVDQRAHGQSQGHTMTLGVRERYDCIDWIKYSISRFGDTKRIFLFGVSMGAATVLLASGLDLPKNIDCIIADSPYSSAENILKKVCSDLKLSVRVIYPLLALAARLYGHFTISDGNVLNAISNASVPILIIHGEDDRFVPCDMSKAIKEAYPDKVRLETFPQAGHGMSYLTDKEHYQSVLLSFLHSLKS